MKWFRRILNISYREHLLRQSNVLLTIKDMVAYNNLSCKRTTKRKLSWCGPFPRHNSISKDPIRLIELTNSSYWNDKWCIGHVIVWWHISILSQLEARLVRQCLCQTTGMTCVSATNKHYPNAVFCPGFQKGRVPSEKGTFSAVSEPSKGHNLRGELKKKGIISAVNGRKRELLTKSVLESHNKRCTAQSTQCVDNKKGKRELKAMCDCIKKRNDYFWSKGQGVISAF